MPTRPTPPDHHPALAEAAARIFHAAATEGTAEAFLGQALPTVCQAAGGEYAAVVLGEKGRWRTLGRTGPERPLPTDLLADALEQPAVCKQADWAAIALPEMRGTGELLLLFRPWPHATEPAGEMVTLAGWLSQGWQAVRTREQERRRTARLQEILAISAKWQQTLEMEPLLLRMAEAATKLLGAERATIFLWDRGTKTLVGRPALGVEGGELRVPEETGVVGQVVRALEPRRVDADVAADQEEIDRRVDKKLRFQTRTLLCVPLLARDGDCLGAFEAINKKGGNFTRDDETSLVELAQHAAVALENTRQFVALAKAHDQVTDAAAQRVQLIGDCPAIQSLRTTIARVAASDLSVLVLGENGTGKEVVSQAIHYQSPRRKEPLVAVNCAALPETLLESELFGHEKGAFTDAREARAGKFELAAKGTLFLDEIGDMSLPGQAKLLRVLEEKVIVRVGGSRPIAVDTRVIAATNQDLGELVRKKKFREDLFFRLNVVVLSLPPLRDREDDVLLLAESFLQASAARCRRRPPQFTAAAKKRLREHRWPGNVRELRNLMERVVFLLPEDREKIDGADLQFVLSPDADAAQVMELDAPLTDATRRFQMEYIKRHIAAARGNMTLAAERLGLHRSNLYRKMGQLGMEAAEDE
jgi:Nif-specific regulatory protein